MTHNIGMSKKGRKKRATVIKAAEKFTTSPKANRRSIITEMKAMLDEIIAGAV
jgi:hypothetical protein